MALRTEDSQRIAVASCTFAPMVMCDQRTSFGMAVAARVVAAMATEVKAMVVAARAGVVAVRLRQCPVHR